MRSVAAVQAPSETAPSRGPGAWQALLANRALRMVAVLLGLWTLLALHPDTREAFLTAGNFSNLTAQVAEIVIMGVGMTMVILVGGIDLSVGAGMALTGVVAAKLQIDHQQPVLIACLAALAVAALVGLWHGVLVTRFAIPPFIATLSGFLAYRGIALVLSDARGLAPMRQDFAALGGRLPVGPTIALCGGAALCGLWLLAGRARRRRKLDLPLPPLYTLAFQVAAIAATASFAGVIYQDGMPVPVLIAAMATAGGALVLTRTRLGRHAIAIGGNAQAARLSGVRVERVTVLIYLGMGLLTAAGGLVAAARTNGVTPGNAGLMRELHVITAVVIGGTSLTGGRATMLGTVIGALIFGTLSNGMNLMNVNSNWQLILSGAILLGASMLDGLSHRKRPS